MEKKRINSTSDPKAYLTSSYAYRKERERKVARRREKEKDLFDLPGFLNPNTEPEPSAAMRRRECRRRKHLSPSGKRKLAREEMESPAPPSGLGGGSVHHRKERSRAQEKEGQPHLP